jgi:hypothetical protein
LRPSKPTGLPTCRKSARYQFLNGAGLFLDSFGLEAERLGWRPDELLGLHPSAPVARHDCMGLVWILRGRRVTELTDKLVRLLGGLAYRPETGRRSVGIRRGSKKSGDWVVRRCSNGARIPLPSAVQALGGSLNPLRPGFIPCRLPSG